MRRLPGILLLTVATLIVIVALLVSGLRLVLPQLDARRPQLLEKISLSPARRWMPRRSPPAGKLLAQH